MFKYKLKSFFESVRFKYKITILNENTLEEAWYIRLSRLNVLLLGSILFIIAFFVISLLILKTPLKNLLPGDAGGVRAKYIETALKVDSLETAMKQQTDYLDVFKSIISGKTIADNIIPLDSFALSEREKLLTTKSDNEREFVQNFEHEELYKLNVSTPKQNSSVTVFFKPTKGLVSDKFNVNQKHYGTHIVTSPNESVYSVLPGVVIFTAFTVEDEFVIGIQHTDDYVSIYKNNSRLLRKIGDNVRAGAPIAVVNTNDKTGSYLHFELWQKGIPLNAQEYIAF